VRELTGDLRTVVDENEARIDRLVANLESFSSDLALLTSENRDSILELVTNFRDASRRLGEAVDSLQQVAAKVEDGEGTLGKLLTDDKLYSEMDASLVEARAALREVRRAAEEAQEQIPATVLTTLIGSLF
jgi:phospholipid/cholesterol/gamma-HCH transport system substrate-binding protein